MTAVDELTCKELVELVTEYLEGTLSPSERRRFEAHLKTCDGCGRYLEHMRHTIRLVGKLSEEAITPEAEQTLLQVFRDWKKG
jgi:anti-sigma factor RsiW